MLNVGLAGFGLSGQVFHAPFIDANPNFNLKKVYERTKSLSKEKYPYVEIVRSFDELLSDEIDLVVLALPNDMHFPLAMKALEAGKHVLIEKPMAQTADEARLLMRKAREKGLYLSAYQNRRFDGDYLTVKNLLSEGCLGQVHDVYERWESFFPGPRRVHPWKSSDLFTGAIYDLGVHMSDQAVGLFGMPDSLYADKRTLMEGGVTDDTFTIILYYGDRKYTISSSRGVLERGPRFEIHGTAGSFVKFGMDPQENALRSAGAKPTDPGFGEDAPENYGSLLLWNGGDVKRQLIPTVRGDYNNFYDNAYDAIVNGAPQAAPPEESVMVLTILEAAHESARTGKRIYFSNLDLN